MKLRAAMLSLILIATGVITGPSLSTAQPAPAQDGLTLERYFPRGGWLTSRAPQQVTFAADGKHAAFLAKGQLIVYDAAADKAVAAVTLESLAKFRNADKDTPARWEGIRCLAWSPAGDDLLFCSEGHVYRYALAQKTVERLTGQRLPRPQIGDVETLRYLPDGSGYLLTQGVDMMVINGVYVGRFNNDNVQRWYPKLPDQGYLVDLRISPDGKQLVLLVNKLGTGISLERHLYLAPISALTDNTPVQARVFGAPFTGPADWVSRVNWSPDSKRFVFAHFAQKTAAMRILTVDVPGGAGPGDRNDSGRGRSPATQPDGTKVIAAKEVHSFTHKGGPSATVQVQPWFLADNTSVVFTCDQSGWLQLHRLDTATGAATQLTKGTFEIYPVAQSTDRKELYVAATKEHAARRDLYRVNLTSGELVRLTHSAGSYGDVQDWRLQSIINVAISPDGSKLLTTFETFGTLKEMVRIAAATGELKTLSDSHIAQARALAAGTKVELFSYKNRHSDTIHGYVIKPKDWKATDQRPALIYAYGGPLGIRKYVMDGDVTGDYLFGAYMAAKHGYVSVIIDPRGSSGYGAEFEKANFGKPGKAGVEDLEDGAKYVIANYGVDAKKVAVHGWSFGGFLTQMCMFTSDVFAVGLAGAGPTEWQNYNMWYTSTVIGQAENLKDYSLVPLAKNLKGQLLLVHGLKDNNVFAQHTLSVLSALLKAGKVTQVELFVDPNGNHGMRGDVMDLDRYLKYEQFLLQRMGAHTAGDHRDGRRAALEPVTDGMPASETLWAMKA
jgi:dipeptidyl aminopeptidase/acylaminoacyl peptidase